METHRRDAAGAALNGLESSRRLTMAYLLSLAAVAVLILIGQFVVQTVLIRQQSDSRIINLAGRQRMLSQRIAMQIAAVENVVNDASDPEFDGHYADKVELSVFESVCPADIDCSGRADFGDILAVLAAFPRLA